jgi:SRSO17 transposase
MEAVDFGKLYRLFRKFHGYFRRCFGRKQYRNRSYEYLKALLVQSSERRNAENLSEVVKGSARVLQRFLTEATWDDEVMIARLQEYLGPMLNDDLAVWCVDDSGFAKQGKLSAGVARQYCNSLGKVAGCQVGVFLAHVGPKGRALVDKRLYLPEAWTNDPARCDAAGIPLEAQRYKSKTELALEMLENAESLGYLESDWVTGDDAYGQSPEFRDSLDEGGFQYVLEVPGITPVWPVITLYESDEWSGRGRPPVSKPVEGQRKTVEERAADLGRRAWHAITVGDGSRGPRMYLFAFERVRESRYGGPGKVLWLIHRKNLDGTEPRYYYSNAPEDTSKTTLGRVAASRWPIETEFEAEKSYAGLDEYEVRSWQGWHHHITMSLLAGAFLLTLQQEWGGKDAPDHPAPGLPDSAGAYAAKALASKRPRKVA